ncbi:MAG TPA: TolC family protein [Verrucomicrobiae bacterium]|nr:TolC family protein [Verrucomicrobiae bacterium]
MRMRFPFLAMLVAGSSLAQVSSFPKPAYFREIFQTSHPRVELKPPVKIGDFVAGGKIELSLRHFLELVMANNTDVQLQLISVEIPRYNILSSYGVWDPTAQASFSTTRSTSLPTSAVQAQNAGELSKSLVQPYSLQYTQTLPSGTNYYVNFSGAKSSETNSFASYNPSLTANLTFGVSQPLIRNRGTYVNRIPLMMAQSNLRVSQYNLHVQLIGLINNAENYYWNVVSARENLQVQEKARDTAAEYLKYMEKQLELGAISPLDIYNPQQSLAANELSVSQARWSLIQAEDALRHQIGVDLDPNLRKLPIALTEPAELGPSESISVDTEQEVSKALSINPAMKYALQRLDVDDLGIQSSKNALLPNLTFSAAYTANGRGGIFYPGESTIFGGNAPVSAIPGGIADALSQMFGFGYPTYYAGLTLTLPIRSKTASANMAIAEIQKKTDALNLRNQQQAIRLNILNAVSTLEGAKEQLKLAIVQRDFARKNLDAENQKYQLGTETNQNVINAQQVLVQAESAVVSNQIGVRRSLLNLLTQTGELLDARGIVVP